MLGWIVEDDEVGGYTWPRSVMDNASDFGSEDCGFESHRGRKKRTGALWMGHMFVGSGYGDL